MKKKVLIITSIVLAFAISFIAFSYTVDELKEVFLTRDEWDSFESSFSVVLETLESNKVYEIYDEAGYQMYRRDILSNEILQSMQSDPNARESLERWSIRRSKELETQPLLAIAPPSYGKSIASPSDVESH